MEEVIEEYIDEKVFQAVQDDQKTIKQELSEDEKGTISIVKNSLLRNNQVINKNASTSIKTENKSTKRKIKTEAQQPKSRKVSKTDDYFSGQVMKLYAYKDCLGKYDSLTKNEDIVLWHRDKDCLIQKYLRQRFDESGLFYYSTNTYSYWEENRAEEFLEIEAVVILKNSGNYLVKILNLDEIENVCLQGDFKSLGLKPYVNYASRPKVFEPQESLKVDETSLPIKDESGVIDESETTEGELPN